MAKLIVTLAIDQHGWCFDNIATVLVKHLASDFQFHIEHHHKITHGRSDVIVNLWWGSTCRLRSYVDAVGHMLCVYDGLSWHVDATSQHQFKLALRNANLVGCCNSQFKQEIEDIFGEDVPPTTLIEDGVDTQMFVPLAQPQRFTLGWCGNSNRSTPGGPKDQKGLIMLRDALGLTGLRANILDAAKGRSRPHKEMPEFYRNVSVQVVAGYVEGTPNPLLEAMACGRPVIATRSDRSPNGPGLSAELIEDGVNGWLVDRTPEALAVALDRVASTPRSVLAEMGVAARQAVEPYSWRKKIANWKEAIQATYELGRKEGVPKPQYHLDSEGGPRGAAKWELLEMSGKFPPQHEANQVLEAMDHGKTPNRPLIWVLSGWRFFSRTLKIIRHLSNFFRFELYPVDQLGIACLPSGKPDLCWSLYPFNDASAGMRMNHKGIPFLLSLRGSFWNIDQGTTGSALHNCKSASAVAVLSGIFREQLVNLCPELRSQRIMVIPNGVEVDGSTPEVKFEGDRPHVVAVGNFNFDGKWRPTKHALAVLRKAGIGGSHHIVGKRKGVKAHVLKNGVQYHGFEPNPLGCIKGADLLVYASEQDVQPSVIMEARALGTPVLCSVHPDSGAHEFVKKGRSGLLYHDDAELIEHAKTLLTPAIDMDMHKWCLQHKQEISWAHCAHGYRELIEVLL